MRVMIAGQKDRWCSILALLGAMSLGASLIFGFAPLRLWPLPILAISVLVHACRHCHSPLRGFALATAFGLGEFATQWWFIIGAKYQLTEGDSLAAIGSCAYMVTALALLFGLFGMAIRYLSPSIATRGVAFATVVGAALVIAQWVPTQLGSPPLGTLGFTQADTPLGQWASCGGVLLVTFWIGWIAGWLVVAWNEQRWIVPLAFAAAPFFVGACLQRIETTHPSGRSISVEVLQGGESSSSSDEQREQTYSSLLAGVKRVDLIVLPEDVLNAPFDRLPVSFMESLRGASRASGASVLLGARTIVQQTAHGNVRNGVSWFAEAVSAYHLHLPEASSQGADPFLSERYDKHRLIPGGEYTMAPLAWILKHLRIRDPYANAIAGEVSQGIFNVKGVPIAVSLCYEFFFGSDIRIRASESEILINIGNNEWVREGPVIEQGLQMAQLRAIETGRYALRGDNIGWSAVISPKGIVERQLTPGKLAILSASIEGRVGSTPYVRFGDAPWLGLWISILCIAAVGRCWCDARNVGRKEPTSIAA